MVLQESANARGDRSDAAKDGFRRGTGAACLALAFQLEADHVGVQVEKRDLLELVAPCVLEQPRQRRARDGAPAEARR